MVNPRGGSYMELYMDLNYVSFTVFVRVKVIAQLSFCHSYAP